MSFSAGCKISVDAAEGSRRITDVIGPGGLIGEQEIICGLSRRIFSAQVTNNGALFLINGDQFVEAFRANLSIAVALAKYQASRSIFVENRRMGYLGPVRQRLARALLDHCYRYSDEDGPIEVFLTQAELASFIGASVTMIEQEFSRLRRRAIVDTRYGSITILKPDALEAIAV
jgi:CRP-like cAMP-binding protein